MPRLKMFCGLPRRKDVSPQYFHDHWRHPHGTLAKNISTLRTYVQSHQTPCALLGADQSLYDGIPEVTFESEADGLGLGTHPTYVRDLLPDEPKFIDMERIFFLFTLEEVVQSGPDPHLELANGDQYWREDQRATTIKLIQLIRAADQAEFGTEDELELGRRIGAFRHVRSRLYRPLHPEGAEFIGVRELWWPTLTAFETGLAKDAQAFGVLRRRAAASVTLLAVAERFI
jgi:hypothetical protein